MAETHELRLKIDAAAAKRGASEFRGAIESVRRAVRDPEEDSAGAFTSLRRADNSGLREVTREAQNAAKGVDGTARASDRAAENIRKLAIQSANSLRVSTDQASRLRERLLSLGDTTGLARLEAGLDRLRTSLTNATSGLDVREARAAYADLASELNRTSRESERLRAESIAAARAEEQAAASARTRTTALERLRAAHDPLFANSQRYEQALREIKQLEDAGALSAARAAQARETASQSLLAAGNAATVYAGKARVSGMHTANMAAQFNDIGVILASGQSPLLLAIQQGTQVSQVLNMMGDRASILSTLKSGFLSMINPVSLATIGIIAGGAALAQWAMSAFDAEVATESLKRQLDTLSTLSTDLSATLDILEMDAAQLAEKYGTAATRARELAIAQAELRRGEIIDALKAQVAELGFIEHRYKQAKGAAELYSNGIKNIASDFKISRAAAADFEGVLLRLGRATTFEEQREALRAIIRHAEDAGIELSQFPPELRAAAINMIELSNESDALQQFMNRAADAIAGATGQTDNWAAAMSGVRAEINAIGAALASIGGGVFDNVAKSAELTALQAGKSVKEAATARIRFQKEQEFAAREQAADAQGGVAGFLQKQLIEAERFQFEEGLRLDSELDKARAATREAARASTSGGGSGSGSGSGRTTALNAERQAVEDLTESLRGRLTSLQEEKLALELVASRQFEACEGARAMAEAQMTMGGAVDATTEALIRQIDAAQKTANEMRKAANAGAQGWLNAVPSYQEAADQIEVEVLDSLSNEISAFAQTGKFDFERLADSILATMADLAARLANRELFGGLLGGSGSGGGGLLSGLFGGGGDGGFLAGLFSEGGYSTQAVARSAVPAAAFKNAPHFAEGGVTPNAAGGGIPAILHQSEAVVPLSRNRSIPVELNGGANGGAGQMLNYAPTYNIQTPDADSFRRTQKQVTAEGFSAAQRAAKANN